MELDEFERVVAFFKKACAFFSLVMRCISQLTLAK